MCQIFRPSLKEVIRYGRAPFSPRLSGPQQAIFSTVAPATSAGIAFDAIGSGARDLGGAFNDLTYTHICTGSSLALYVHVANAGNGALTVSSVTYNGTAMTQLWALDTSGGVEAKSLGYILINPATGSHSVVITLSGNGGGTLGGASTSWTGVNQTGGVGNSWRTPTNGAGGTATSSITAANAQSGDVVVDGVVSFNGAGVMAPNHTSRVVQDPLTVGSSYAAGTQSQPATGSETMTWTNCASLWSGGVVPLIPA